MSNITSPDDLPKYTGPHEPSKELEPYLKYLFPDVDDAQSNVFFRYRKGRGFISELENYLSDHVYPRDGDVTIVIENGANATKQLDNKFDALGIGPKRTSGIYNCYILMLQSQEHGSITDALSQSIHRPEPPNFSSIIKGLRSADCQLDARIVHRLTNNKISRNGAINKQPDISFVPRYRANISKAFGKEYIPTFIGEVTKTQSADSLLMAAKSWLGGSKLLVESVLAVQRWCETLSIVFYHFDCRVENLLRLLDGYNIADRVMQCLRLVIEYKCLRWLIELRVVMFLMDHPDQNFGKVREYNLTSEIEGQFQQLNNSILEYNNRLQALENEGPYVISAKRGLHVYMPGIIANRELFIERAQFYENTLARMDREGHAANEVGLKEAIVTVSGLVFKQSLRPAAVLGPVAFGYIVRDDIHLTVPLQALTGLAGEITLDSEHLTTVAEEAEWDIVDLHDFSTEQGEIRWEWIQNSDDLARVNNTTVDELRLRLGHYLKGRLRLEYLTLDRLVKYDRDLREENAGNAALLEIWGVLSEERAYLLELERFLRNDQNDQNGQIGQDGHNAVAFRNSLEWSVRLQCYLQKALRKFQKEEEENRRAALSEEHNRAQKDRSSRYNVVETSRSSISNF